MSFGSNLRQGTARGLRLLAHGNPTVVVDDGASPISTSSVRHWANRKAAVTGVTHRFPNNPALQTLKTVIW